ncbi:unnamed protein product, partial [Mesorhabditis belari]|uniref:Uncharacterized protein n=1 Tax=Mesorhabditis belari TaxID=2138241 RepID=A0AAF3FLZ9_9BILA
MNVNSSIIIFLSFIELSRALMNNPYRGPSTLLTKFLQEQHVPSAPPDGVIIVNHEMELVHIIALDELKQTMRVLVYVVQEWNDPSLSWDPQNFANLTHTWLPINTVWIPDIIVFNMLEHSELLKAVRTPVKIEYTGRVTFTYPAIYAVMCELKIKDFPFDDQSCTLRVASWGYDQEKILMNASNKAHLEHYLCNEEWALRNVGITNATYQHEGLVVSEVEYEISVRRKPLFYMITLVLPSYIICILSVAGLFAHFSTKNERQERFTLGVTAILTMAVLSLVVAEKVPHSSEEVPLMVVYFHFNIITVTMATVFTSTVMRVHWKGLQRRGAPPPWILRALYIKEHEESHKDDDEGIEEDVEGDLPSTSCGVPKLNPNRNQGLRRKLRHSIIKSEQWHSISRRLDYLLTFIFILLITGPTLYMFYKNHERMEDGHGGLVRACQF